MTTITTAQAAVRLNVTVRWIQALIKAGRLPAVRFGRDWQIEESDLVKVADLKVGRPRTHAAPNHVGNVIGCVAP
jgi:excisionase family DNA binding protein